MNKKKIIIIAIVVAVLIIGAIAFAVISGNSDSDSDKSSKKSGKSGKAEISKVEEKEVVAEEEKADDKKQTVNLGESIKTEDLEMTVMQAKFLKEILIPKGYSTWKASIDSGKQALALIGSFQTLRGEAISRASIKGKVIINDKYTYDLEMFSSEIEYEPLCPTDYYLYAQVPETLVNSYEKAEFIFGYNDDFGYGSDVEKMDNVFSVTITK